MHRLLAAVISALLNGGLLAALITALLNGGLTTGIEHNLSIYINRSP